MTTIGVRPAEELLREVRRLEITARHAVTAVFAGEYSSAFKGRGMEFAEVREYAPGDDVRAIDWNVTARSGRPFIKRFTEERELTVVLALDVSASGLFGSAGRPKRALAAEVCALLAFAASRKNDRVGLLAYSDRVELFLPPRKGHRHVLRVIRDMLSLSPVGRGTDHAVAARHLVRAVRRRAVVFLVSDFLDAPFEEGLRVASARHEVVALRVTDPREHVLANAGLVDLRDAETGRVLALDSGSPRVRRWYAALADRRAREFREGAIVCGADVLDITSGSEYAHDLMMFFHARERRR